jgi:hypothetical protein
MARTWQHAQPEASTSHGTAHAHGQPVPTPPQIPGSHHESLKWENDESGTSNTLDSESPAASDLVGQISEVDGDADADADADADSDSDPNIGNLSLDDSMRLPQFVSPFEVEYKPNRKMLGHLRGKRSQR